MSQSKRRRRRRGQGARSAPCATLAMRDGHWTPPAPLTLTNINVEVVGCSSRVWLDSGGTEHRRRRAGPKDVAASRIVAASHSPHPLLCVDSFKHSAHIVKRHNYGPSNSHSNALVRRWQFLVLPHPTGILDLMTSTRMTSRPRDLMTSTLTVSTTRTVICMEWQIPIPYIDTSLLAYTGELPGGQCG